MNRLLSILAVFFISVLPGFSQNTSLEGPEMADKLRDNGMFYIVVGVLLIILLGILTYLISLDRKVSKIENEINSSDKK